MKPSGFILAALLPTLMALNVPGATRIWDGGSAGSGTWTADVNWVGNVQPEPGDDLIFPSGATRLSNTNTFPSHTVFGRILFLGNNYHIYGSPVITQSITASNGAVNNVFHAGIRLAAGLDVLKRGASERLTLSGNIDLNGHTLRLSSEGILECAGSISGTGAVLTLGNGSVEFTSTSANTYSGITQVGGSVLRLSKFRLLNGVKTPRIAVAGDLFVGGSGTAMLLHSVVFEANQQISTNSQVTVESSGNLNLNTYLNTLRSLRMGGGQAWNGVLTVTANLEVYGTNSSIIAGQLNLGPAGTFAVLNENALLSISAVVGGAADARLHVSGEGVLRLTGANTYAGPTVLHSGTVRLENAGVLGDGSNGTLLEGGRLELLNTTMGARDVTVTGPATIATTGTASPWTGTVTLENNVTIETPFNSTLEWSGPVSGAGGFAKTGPGVFRLSGTNANTFAGGAAVQQGALELAKSFNGQGVVSVPGPLIVGDGAGGAGADVVRYAAPSQVGDPAHVTVNLSGVVQLTGSADLIGSLSGVGEVNLGGATGRLLVGGNSISTNFAGALTGAGSLVKTGATTLTLSGTSTHQREILVAQGTLLVNGRLLAGSTNSILQVHALATLGGTGHVDKVTIFPSGRLAPGASAGVLTVSNLWFNSAGQLLIELNGPMPGVGYDRVTAHGAITNFPNGGMLAVSLGFVPTIGDSFLILNKTSPGPISSPFNGLAEGTTFPAGGRLFRITYTGGDGNDVVLTRVATPPSTLTSLNALPGGSKRLRGLGVPDLLYTIEAATNLNAPIGWTALGTDQANPSGPQAGVYEFLDTNAPLHPRRFYRAFAP